MARMVSAPQWCPPELTPSQRRRIQWIRMQKLREGAAKKERDEHFNNIRLVIPLKQEWRVNEKTNTPVLTASHYHMDLLDDDESPLIKRTGLRLQPAWISTWCSCCQARSGTSRRRSLRCTLVLRRSCLRSLMSRASTISRCTSKATLTEDRSPGCSSTAVLPST
jgi:hypothetical protein